MKQEKEEQEQKMKLLEPKFVQKVWGEEKWVVNRDYCGKLLRVMKGFRCSLHHHKNKDETFYINEGRVLLELGEEGMVMNKGDAILVKPNQDHRFTGLTDAEIIEFSTHHDDSDSYRQEGELSGEVDIENL